ncbi:MAG: DNA polymerase [Thermoplasmatales archaeon]
MLIQIDAAQLEWRILAWLSSDKVAIDEINAGIDFHSENQVLFNLPSRLIAKIYLFRTIYRGSGFSFAHDPAFRHVSTDPDYWDDINKKFYNKYKGIDKWHHELAELCAARKPIISPLGREWLITPIQKTVFDYTTKQEKLVFKLPWTVFTNYPVQGTGNDLMAIGRISLFNRMKRLSLKSVIVSTVHDSIVIDSPKDEVEKVSQTAIEVFNDIPKNIKKIFGVTLPVAFPGEVKVGHNLRDMVPLDKFLRG